MRNRRGIYPTVQPDADGAGVVSQAGGVMLTETVSVAGLDTALSRALNPWRKQTAVHDPAEVLLDLAVSLALGGTCLADIAVLRGARQVFGPVASDPTVSRTIDALAADASAALAAIDTARTAARAAVWQLAGSYAPNFKHTIDRRSGRDVDQLPQREGAGRGDVQAWLWSLSAVGVC